MGGRRGTPKHAGWRRGRDSNPRYPCEYAAFRVRCFQPLSHLSGAASPNARSLASQAPLLLAFLEWHSARRLLQSTIDASAWRGLPAYAADPEKPVAAVAGL